MLTHSEFEGAVKDALRHCNQVDLLAGNPLLGMQLVAHAGQKVASPQALRSLLVKTAGALFADDRDKKFLRVLELTYFNPASKQEAAAQRLSLSFSTYRRHLALAVGRLIEWLWQRELQAQDPATVENERKPAAFVEPGDVMPAPKQRRRLSIVILPFLNLAEAGSVEYLVDGIVDSLITDLSSYLPGSFVVSRSTAFTYKGRAVPLRQVGEELGVRYVVEGSVLVDSNRVRVNVQLIDAEADEHVWAERFDKERREILQLHDEIVGRLSRSIGIEMVRFDAARAGSEAIDLIMRARALLNNAKREENTTGAIELFRRALQVEPNCVEAMVGIALAQIYRVINLYRLEERVALLDEAEELISRAASLSPDHHGMLQARGLLLRARGRFPEAVIATENLIARNPAEPTAYKEMGLNKLYLGQTREAVEWFRRADAIAPRDPDRWTWLQGLGRALIQLGDAVGAVDALSKALDNNQDDRRSRAMLAAAEALSGNIRVARRYLTEYAAAEPGMTVGRFSLESSSVPPEAVSRVYRQQNEQILDGLRRAGMPD